MEVPASLLFAVGVASAALFDRGPRAVPMRLVSDDLDDLGRLLPGGASTNLLEVVARPVNPVLWVLLASAVLAAGLHIVLRWRQRFSPPMQRGITVGLVLGGVWPWLAVRWPVPSMLVAGVAAGALLVGMMTETRRQRQAALLPLGVIAAWVVIAGLCAMGTAMSDVLGMKSDLAALLALLALSLIGARLQLMIGSNVSFGLTLIWSMIGIAGASIGGSGMTIPTAAVLGIASLAVVIVRVTT